MNCVLPFCGRDLSALEDLLSWMSQLGGCHSHDCLLVCDAATPYQEVLRVMASAQAIFNMVRIITNNGTIQGWPSGANSLFYAAAKTVQTEKLGHWLWLEPDAIPLCKNWLDQLETEYHNSASTILGCVYECDKPGLPKQNLSGIAVYPENLWSVIEPLSVSPRAFDLAINTVTINQAKHTPLIQHFWGRDGLPPTFDKSLEVNGNFFDVNVHINKGAIIFHRSKDGSLIRKLREIHGFDHNLLIVLPVCPIDCNLLLKSLEWQVELDGIKPFDAIVSCDTGLGRSRTNAVAELARKTYRTVEVFSFIKPPKTNHPWGANFAFIKTAFYMLEKRRSPWFWMEPDCIPLKPGWLNIWQNEYFRCSKPIMGVKVPQLGHINGTAVYPWNFAKRSPSAMSATNTAWDWQARNEIVPIAHDAGHLLQHLWAVNNGRVDQTNGNAPSFPTQTEVSKWVNLKAIMLHRNKDGTLIDRLRERRKG